MSESKDNGLVEMTLESVCDGALEQQFQERLEEVRQFVGDARRRVSKDGLLAIKIPIEVEVIYDAADETFNVEAVALDIKKPKPKAITRSAYLRRDGFKVLPEVQEEIPGTVADIRRS